jgi:hypothetical protein
MKSAQFRMTQIWKLRLNAVSAASMDAGCCDCGGDSTTSFVTEFWLFPIWIPNPPSTQHNSVLARLWNRLYLLYVSLPRKEEGFVAIY